ncbi:peptidylprolyl isomerase [Altererythrobacter sp. ZODW24]|uniref:peptidylprolyl isomerase n=1 Tax=Altererythrobacter sp. ZODW24 TaxID=2185142 RepID=UPI000DF7F5E0|nr:peptidylprolyl isomerase [Altererythrobacter sp. ZODW24]
MKTHTLPAALPAALIAASLGLSLALPAAAQEADERPTPNSVIEAAAPEEWAAIPTSDLMVMRLADDAEGNRREVVIQLMPKPFSQGWVDNIRLLANTSFWDGTTVYRVVDNWVTQWGDGEDNEELAKPLPEGIKVVPESEYVAKVPDEKSEQAGRFGLIDSYAEATDFRDGFPIVQTGDYWWPTHCYASVGVARDLTPNTGTGAELYTVIGHAPRQLDRNIAVVGRVIEGMEHLSTLPRGKGGAGVYADDSKRVPIEWVRMADDLSEEARPKFEYLATESASFERYVKVRANRGDSFYQVAAGGVDICNVQVPIRRITDAE